MPCPHPFFLSYLLSTCSIIPSSWLGQIIINTVATLPLYVYVHALKTMDTLLLCFLVLVSNARNNLSGRWRGDRIDLLYPNYTHRTRASLNTSSVRKPRGAWNNNVSMVKRVSNTVEFFISLDLIWKSFFPSLSLSLSIVNCTRPRRHLSLSLSSRLISSFPHSCSALDASSRNGNSPPTEIEKPKGENKKRKQACN